MSLKVRCSSFILRACYLRGEKVIATQTLVQRMEIYTNTVPPQPPAPHGKLILDCVYECQDSDNPYCGGSTIDYSGNLKPSLSWRE